MSKENPIQYRSAGGVVVDAHGQVLLIERTVDGQHEVRLPKGHIEPGEVPEATALREVCEETGYCDLHIVADLGVAQVSFQRRDGRVIRDEHYYLMRLASQRRRAPQFASEREALFENRWVAGFREAEQSLTFEAEKDVIRRARAAYGDGSHSGSHP